MNSLSRNTKYTNAVMEAMSRLHHATNAEIQTELAKEFPGVSATTIHRVTSRLAVTGRLAHAPADENGNFRYDYNTLPHHHFYCNCCKSLKDISLDKTVIDHLKSEIDDCQITSSLMISGSCKKCVLTKKGLNL